MGVVKQAMLAAAEGQDIYEELEALLEDKLEELSDRETYSVAANVCLQLSVFLKERAEQFEADEEFDEFERLMSKDD